MATTTNGIYYRTNGEAAATSEAQALSLANSVDKAIGLVPIIPTSVTVGSGSASVAADGKVTFSNCNYFDIINAFNSNYVSYKIVFEDLFAAGIDYLAQFVLVNSSGTANGASFGSQRLYSQSTSTGGIRYGANSFGYIGYITSSKCSSEIIVHRPMVATYTSFQAMTTYLRLEGGVYWPNIECWHSNLADSGQYPTIRFYSPSGNISGAVKIYGLR